MNLSKTAAILASVSLLGLAGVTASFAQPAGGAPRDEQMAGFNATDAGPGGPGMRGRGPMNEQDRAARMAEHQERMASRLRAVLQLRQDQEPALQALLAAMKPPERPDRQQGDRPRPDQMTTPQRLDFQAARMAERQQAFAARSAAIRKFYGQLSPAQQKAFDALGPMGGGRGERGGPGRMGGRGGMGRMGPGGMGGMGPMGPPPGQ
ncbi:MAG: Spy/CpxP family protein refolding chaperone [Caulobacteraceae bacterium]